MPKITDFFLPFRRSSLKICDVFCYSFSCCSAQEHRPSTRLRHLTRLRLIAYSLGSEYSINNQQVSNCWWMLGVTEWWSSTPAMFRFHTIASTSRKHRIFWALCFWSFASLPAPIIVVRSCFASAPPSAVITVVNLYLTSAGVIDLHRLLFWDVYLKSDSTCQLDWVIDLLLHVGKSSSRRCQFFCVGACSWRRLWW